MDICVDSNILIYSLNEFSEFRDDTLRAVYKLRSSGDNLIVFPQNLVEFWAVTTRPISSNGLGFTTPQAAAELTQIRTIFQLINEIPAIYPEWERLVVANKVSGKNVHDARIVAQMNVHQVGSILTFNVKDFNRFTNVRAIDPASV